MWFHGKFDGAGEYRQVDLTRDGRRRIRVREDLSGPRTRGIDPIMASKAELPVGLRLPMSKFKYDAKHQIVRCRPRGRTLYRSPRDKSR